MYASTFPNVGPNYATIELCRAGMETPLLLFDVRRNRSLIFKHAANQQALVLAYFRLYDVG